MSDYNTPEEMIEVLQAFLNGAAIQWWSTGKSSWEDWIGYGSDIRCNFVDFKFRVKPEPKPDVVAEYSCNPNYTYIYCHTARKADGKTNLRLTYDGETGELKFAEVLK